MKSRLLRSACGGACATVALLFGACEVEPGPVVFGDLQRDAGGSAEDTGGLEGEGLGIPTMNGTWLMVHEQSNCVETLGVFAEAVSVTLEIVQMQQNGGRVTEDHQICSINLSPLIGLQTAFPERASQTHRPIRIEDSMVSGNTPGSGYASGVEHQLFGLDMVDPLGDDMPVDRDDPRLRDDDEDGAPGVSLLVSGGARGGGCDMWVAQRSSIRYIGTFERPNLIRGRSVTNYAQSLLGASSVLCATSRTVVPNDRSSRFELRRIDGLGGSLNLDLDRDGTITCSEVNSRLEDLWTFRDPDNTQCGGEN